MIPKSAVKVDYSRDALFDEMGMRRLKDSYMRKNEKSPQDRYSYVARALASNAAHAQRIYDYASMHWLSFSTPILSYGLNKRALPISCYLSYIPDSAAGLVDTMQEVAYLSMMGGGVGLGMGIRAEDEKSVGVMPHNKVYEAISLAYRQGKTRRGSFATYLGIGHPNIVQHIEMRKPTGDHHQRCQELHHGVNIPDAFMEIIERCMLDDDANDDWPLIDPHSGEVREVVSARMLWELIIATRIRTGEPFMHFIDRSNEFLPDYQKALGLSVRQSNICTEITLATDEQRTAVCCLASLNAVYRDQWKDNHQFFRDVAELLDNALSIFIKKAPRKIKRAVYSAMRERSIGIGVLGFHAYLQSKMIPFESALAVSINKQIFSGMRKHLDEVNYELAVERGPCPDAATAGVMKRFSHMIAIAPNASSSIIMGNTSPSIEPFRNNGYRQDTLSGSYMNRNQFLDKIIKERCANDDDYNEAWSTVIASAGSAQGLKFLSDYEKDVFKTFAEIKQAWVVQHANDRAPDIDQAQSLNLCYKPTEELSVIHDDHFKAWKGDGKRRRQKTLYYLRSEKIYHGESMNKAVASRRRKSTVAYKTLEVEGCLACE